MSDLFWKALFIETSWVLTTAMVMAVMTYALFLLHMLAKYYLAVSMKLFEDRRTKPDKLD